MWVFTLDNLMHGKCGKIQMPVVSGAPKISHSILFFIFDPKHGNLLNRQLRQQKTSSIVADFDWEIKRTRGESLLAA